MRVAELARKCEEMPVGADDAVHARIERILGALRGALERQDRLEVREHAAVLAMEATMGGWMRVAALAQEMHASGPRRTAALTAQCEALLRQGRVAVGRVGGRIVAPQQESRTAATRPAVGRPMARVTRSATPEEVVPGTDL